MKATHYCIKNAIAQALKVSDADTEKKLCQNGGQTSVNSGTVDCQAGPQSHKLGLVAFYDGSAPSNQPSWPYEKKNSGTNGKGAENVAKNILTLTKDEKVKVAGHRDVFSSYNNRDPKMGSEG